VFRGAREQQAIHDLHLRTATRGKPPWGVVIAADDADMLVGRERQCLTVDPGHRVDVVRLAMHADGGQRLEVPQPQRPIIAGGRQPAARRRDRDLSDAGAAVVEVRAALEPGGRVHQTMAMTVADGHHTGAVVHCDIVRPAIDEPIGVGMGPTRAIERSDAASARDDDRVAAERDRMHGRPEHEARHAEILGDDADREVPASERVEARGRLDRPQGTKPLFDRGLVLERLARRGVG
jgi:hypothetical protein